LGRNQEEIDLSSRPIIGIALEDLCPGVDETSEGEVVMRPLAGADAIWLYCLASRWTVALYPLSPIPGIVDRVRDWLHDGFLRHFDREHHPGAATAAYQMMRRVRVVERRPGNLLVALELGALTNHLRPGIDEIDIHLTQALDAANELRTVGRFHGPATA
jgi:hypothetical protein